MSAAAASAVEQHVLSLCLLSSGSHKALSGCTVCVNARTACCREMFECVCVSAWMLLCVCVKEKEIVSLWPLYPPATETQRSFLTARPQSWLPPFSEIKSFSSQASYCIRAAKHRCSTSGTDNVGLKDHLRLAAYTIKGLCVGPDLIYQRRSTQQSILPWVTVDFLFVD